MDFPKPSHCIIEAGNSSNIPKPDSDDRKKAKLTRSPAIKIISLTEFIILLVKIRKRPSRLFNRRLEPEAERYNRLMDDLEDEMDPPGCYAKVLLAAEVLLLLGLVAALVVTVTVKDVKDENFLTLTLWHWVVLVMVLVSGMSAVRFLTFLVFTPVKWRWRVHRYVVYVLEEIKWCVDMTLWLMLVLVVWYLWFRPKVCNTKGDVSRLVAHQTTRLLIALVLGSIFWTLKNVLYLKLKADLHYRQLYDRIKQTILDYHGIQIIYNEGMWKFLTSHKNAAIPDINPIIFESMWKFLTSREKATTPDINPANEDNKKMKGKNIWMDVSLMNKETVPIWVLHRLAQVYLKHMKKVGLPRKRDVTRGDQKLMAEAQQMLSQVIREEGRWDILPKDLEKYELNVEERKYLFGLFINEDEKEEGKLQSEDDPKQCIEVISEDSVLQQHNVVISRDQFLSWAVVAYKNCWGLERTLRSSHRVFIKLKRILNTFLITVIIIIWLLLSKIVDTAQLAILFAPFVTATFIFGETSKKMFEGLIFTFAMHPFDVGDRVVIDNIQMKVIKLNILTSVFFKYDTGEELVYPNSLLASTKITNLDITPDQADSVEFTVPSSTPLEEITDLELKITKVLDEDITYSSQTKVAKKEVTREDIKMVVYFKYLVSYLSAETKAMHRSRILTKIMELKKEMECNLQMSSSVSEDRSRILTKSIELNKVMEDNLQISSSESEYKSRFLPKIMELNKEYYNLQMSSSLSELGRVHFVLPAKVTMEKIGELKHKMFDDGFHIYKEHSKMLMTALDKKNIEMVVHLKYENSLNIEDSDYPNLKDFEQHVASVIRSSGGQLKGRALWSTRLSNKVLSLGRTSKKEDQVS